MSCLLFSSLFFVYSELHNIYKFKLFPLLEYGFDMTEVAITGMLLSGFVAFDWQIKHI